MTIRYTCRECASVLKIKDEKAGTNGKCPKCKTEFVVPSPASEDDIEVEMEGSAPAPVPAAPIDDDVDMPIELTPEVADDPDFDPLDVLSAPVPAKPTAAPATRTTSFGTDKKPSVAELMRDFEASKKKDRKTESTPEAARPSAGASPEQSAGSAADALSRAYQQKRDSANAPKVSVKDAQAAEQRALLMEFIKKKAAPAIAAIAVVLYGYYWYMFSESYKGLPLYPVTGKVISQTEPVEGLRVQFRPISESIEDTRSSAEGMTAKDGSFRLIYEIPYEGAPEGKYEVVIFGSSGAPLTLSAGTPMLSVSASGKNEFEISL